MISSRLFSLTLFFAISLILFQLSSGIWLFIEKFGFFPSSVYSYFAGDEENFIVAKSLEGLLETTVPHCIAISTTIFVYAHFLLFTSLLSKKQKNLLIGLLFLFSFLDIFSGFGMIYGYEIFAWIKVLSFWGFEILMGLLLYILFHCNIKASFS